MQKPNNLKLSFHVLQRNSKPCAQFLTFECESFTSIHQDGWRGKVFVSWRIKGFIIFTRVIIYITSHVLPKTNGCQEIFLFWNNLLRFFYFISMGDIKCKINASYEWHLNWSEIMMKVNEAVSEVNTKLSSKIMWFLIFDDDEKVKVSR